MMLILSLLMAVSQAAAPLLQGEWQNVDVRSVEVNGDGACIRVWLEERKYSLQAIPDRRYQGAYQNVVHAVPVGAASFSPTCKYPALTSNPVATQTRMWAVVASPISDQRWRLRAQAGPGGGDFSLLASGDFTTELAPVNDRLFDGTGPTDDANEVLVFRTPAKPPAEARLELEATIAKLYAGGCLEVMSALATRKEALAELCALRQQMAQLQGQFVSISMTAETEFDRVPASVSSPGASGLRRQRGVFYEFTGTFDKARVPGNAIVVEESGKWRVAALWF